MTNPIEEMMKTAGVEKITTCDGCPELIEEWCNRSCFSYRRLDLDYDECSIAMACYPEFTAEKQLEIIKLIGKLDLIITNSKLGYFMCTGLMQSETFLDECFDIVLAKLTNDLMIAGALNKDDVRKVLEYDRSK